MNLFLQFRSFANEPKNLISTLDCEHPEFIIQLNNVAITKKEQHTHTHTHARTQSSAVDWLSKPKQLPRKLRIKK